MQTLLKAQVVDPRDDDLERGATLNESGPDTYPGVGVAGISGHSHISGHQIPSSSCAHIWT